MSTTMDQIHLLDEAHLLEKETIEEFRFLLNYRFDSESPMALVLVGQTELWEDKLRFKRYDAVRQRIDINCVLPHLNRAETEKYIQSHLVYAGIKDRVMYGCQQNLQILDDQDILYVSEHEMLQGGDGK